jgi:biopolymer transport protein TolQ
MVPVAAQISFWRMIGSAGPVPWAVMVILLGFSVLSFAIFFTKFGAFRRAAGADGAFLQTFRKAPQLNAMAGVVTQHRAAPMAAVFDNGYVEVSRQVSARKRVTNLWALERSLQLGSSEALAPFEKNMNWLATTAAVAPFVGLLGTVVGIIDAFQSLSGGGAANLQAVGPGISEALFTTALGLFAAIPAAIMYNYFGNALKEMGQRLDDFSLEFMNLTERDYSE